MVSTTCCAFAYYTSQKRQGSTREVKWGWALWLPVYRQGQRSESNPGEGFGRKNRKLTRRLHWLVDFEGTIFKNLNTG